MYIYYYFSRFLLICISFVQVIGLHLLAKCCEYNPAEMPRVLMRFNAITDNGPASSVLQYISMHPCNDDRIANQKHLLPGIELEQARHCHKY